MSEKQQFNIYLPAELVRTLKHEAIDADRSLSQFVEEILRARTLQAAGPARPGSDQMLRPLPIVYVTSMKKSLQFYKRLGFAPQIEGQVWSQLELGGYQLALHATEVISKKNRQVGLAMIALRPLEEIRENLIDSGVPVDQEIVDEAFGRSLTIRDPDGLPIQINEHQPGLFDA